SLWKECMTTIVASSEELHAIEKLREEELEGALSIQSVMLPAESLPSANVQISHAFQPVREVGGDFLDYLPDALDGEGESFGIERLQAFSETQSPSATTALLDELFSAVSRFSRGRAQHDDMAAAIFRYSREQE